MFGTSKLNN